MRGQHMSEEMLFTTFPRVHACLGEIEEGLADAWATDGEGSLGSR